MRMKVAGFLGTFLLVGLQFAPYPVKLTNPPSDLKASVLADAATPPKVGEILSRSCMNCHSNATVWPWYSHVAPASWLVATDVAKAREAMNFSEWGHRPPMVRLGWAAASCEDVKIERMPKKQYLLAHPEARLSAADREALCAWSQGVMESAMRSRGAAQQAE